MVFLLEKIGLKTAFGSYKRSVIVQSLSRSVRLSRTDSSIVLDAVLGGALVIYDAQMGTTF